MIRQRRLLLVVTSMARGGAEQQVVDLAMALRARDWVVAVLSMTTPSDHVDELIAAGIDVTTLNMRRGRPTPASFVRYGAFVRRWRPDIIHSHMVHANLLARIGRLFAPTVPVVCTVHTVMEGRRWRAIAYRLTDRLANTTTAVSQAAADQSVRVGAVPGGRVTVIPNGFAFTRARIADGAGEAIRRELGAVDGFLWVSVGRLVPEKGHDLLVDAFEMVREKRPDARLAIAGDGPLRPALDQLVAGRGLTGSAILLGERRDVPALLAAGNAFVLSSRWEGLPMVLLEAAAQALPIVCTDVGGCREVARPELGAILARTNPIDLARGMLRVMDLAPAERARTGEQLRNLVRSEFDMDAVVVRWEELYTSLMARE
jgi:glycosyltransferase involved in cell wall biosynthesis